MPRILFFVFIAFLVWLAVRVLGSQRKRNDAERDAPAATPSSLTGSEPIRQCAWCGVHVPVGEAVTLPDGRLYCSASHRDAAVVAAATAADPSRT